MLHGRKCPLLSGGTHVCLEENVLPNSHLLKNFPQFIVIHTVKGFGIVNKAEIDVFLELSCFLFFFNVNLFILIGGELLYNIVLVLPYISMNPPLVYTCSPSWTPLPPPSPFHPSGSSQCTSPKHPVSCIEPGLEIHFTYDYPVFPAPLIKKTVLEEIISAFHHWV